MRHIVFFLGYIYFLYYDFRDKKIDSVALYIYAFIALFTVALTRNDITMTKFVDVVFSIAFGLIIYMLSYFTNESIGIADGVFFAINGFLLTLRENIVLFLTGLFVAFIIGLILFFFSNKKGREESRVPFMPCILPAVIGYLICIV